MIPIDQIKAMAKEKNYGFNHYKHPLDEPTKIVLIGERHAAYLDYKFQGSLIDLLKPEIVMHEFYESNGTLSKSNKVNVAIEWINRWKDDYNIQLKPCDLSKNKIQRFHQMFYTYLKDISEFNDESDLKSIIGDDNALRELVMGKLIRAEAAKTDKPLIAIVGGYHTRPESKIHEELRCHRAIEKGYRNPFGYVTINQDDILTGMLQDGAEFFR